MKNTTDVSLVHRIAFHRDKRAFDELLSRYENLLYSIALRFTKRNHLAEDAIQQAMLSVWQNSQKFREGGSVRGWMVAILVSECGKVLRKVRRQKNQVELDAPERIEDTRTQRVEPEREELIRCVRIQFSGLPLLHQQLLTLSYASDLSQREIGKILKIPQRTVSDHMNKALGALRSNLCQAGMAATAPRLTSGAIKESLESGFEMPPSLREHILDSVVKRPVDRMQSIVKAHIGVAASVLISLALASGLWAINRFTVEDEHMVDLESSEGSLLRVSGETSIGEPSLETMPKPRFWDFERLPDDFENLFEGKDWCWGFRGDLRTGCLLTYPKLQCVAMIPQQFSTRPFKIELNALLVIQGAGDFGFHWSNGQRALAHRWVQYGSGLAGIQRWKKSKSSPHRERAVFKDTWYFFDQYAVSCRFDRVDMISQYSSSYPGNRIVFHGKNVAIEELGICWLKFEDIPEHVRNAVRKVQKAGTQWSDSDASPLFTSARASVQRRDSKRWGSALRAEEP